MYAEREPGPKSPSVLIVAEHASARFGGEAVLPLHYFRVLRARGVRAHLVVHERTREELEALFPNERSHISYVRDTDAHVRLWSLQSAMPRRLGDASVGVLLRLLTQTAARELARTLVRTHGFDVVHQPMPVSPKDPSLLHGLGVPVVIGPMNGGMTYPPAFEALESRLERATIRALRRGSPVVHRLLRGKREATTLVVANDRTARALPVGMKGRVVTLVENGVDLQTFRPRSARESAEGLRAAFVGRLVDWKALDVVLEAMTHADRTITLDVFGDGPMRAHWEALASTHGLAGRVAFKGFVPQDEVARALDEADVLVLPSIYECGGAVVLEAMAKGLPVIATNWGGPADYLDARTGILVSPTSREALVAGFAQALDRLLRDPAERARLGEAAREHARTSFDWEAKVTTMLGVYEEAIARFGARA